MKYKTGDIVYLKIQKNPQPHWIESVCEKTKEYIINDKIMFSPSLMVEEDDIQKAPSPENA